MGARDNRAPFPRPTWIPRVKTLICCPGRRDTRLGHPADWKTLPSVRMSAMRGLLVILLVVTLSAPLMAAFFASSESLPACCRRNGKHHCMSRVPVAPGVPAFATPKQGCPYFPQSAPAPHSPDLYSHPAFTFYAAVVSHPTSHAQTEARSRISLSRSHQKRGPPSLVS